MADAHLRSYSKLVWNVDYEMVGRSSPESLLVLIQCHVKLHVSTKVNVEKIVDSR